MNISKTPRDSQKCKLWLENEKGGGEDIRYMTIVVNFWVYFWSYLSR